MRVIIFGATGSAGGSVLDACLNSALVSKVVAVCRRPLEISSAKLEVVLHQNYNDLSAVSNAFQNIDACFFCLGISSTQVKEEKRYREITIDYAVTALTEIQHCSPNAAFHYLSGAGANINGTAMWQRVKGEAEQIVIDKGQAVCWRPAFIDGKPSKSEPKLFKYSRPFFRVFKPFKSFYVAGEDIGRAMIYATHNNARATIYQNSEIRDLSRQL